MHCYIIVAFWAGYRGNAIINPSMITNCIRCKSKLIPIIHGRLDPEVLDMQNKGLLLISLDNTRMANSYCPLCEEAYMDFTDLPSNLHE
jgi:hypothetical protein